MKAIVYRRVGKSALQEHADPEIGAPTDAIVRATKTTICGVVRRAQRQSSARQHGGDCRFWADRTRGTLGRSIHRRSAITHRFTMNKIVEAYDTFGGAAQSDALKALISAK